MLTLPTESVLLSDEDRGLRLVARAEAGEQFRRHLAEVRFGTTGVRYRRLNIEEQLERLSDAVFLELMQDDRLLGTYVLAQRTVHTPAGPAAGIYRGLLTMAEEAQGQGLGRLLAAAALDMLAERSARQDVATLSWGHRR